MYAKIFTQIFDSSIAQDPELRFTFMDFLVLADLNGVVDMTHEAIARRTNRPLEIIRKTIEQLEGPDSMSRTADDEGRRLKRLDSHRSWGWVIINYERFRRYVTEDHRRAKTRERVRRYRQRVTNGNIGETPCNNGAPSSIGESVTLSNIPVTERIPKKRHAEVEVEVEVNKKHTAPPKQPAGFDVGKLWIDTYARERDGAKYRLTGPDRGAIKQLQGLYGKDAERLLPGIFQAYLADNDPWVNKQAWPLFRIIGRTHKYEAMVSTEASEQPGEIEDSPEDLADFGASA